jgi:hypothetical protein
LALLLSSFGASNLSSPGADAETNKLTEAFNRIGRFSRWIKSIVRSIVTFIFRIVTFAHCREKKNQIADQTDGILDGGTPGPDNTALPDGPSAGDKANNYDAEAVGMTIQGMISNMTNHDCMSHLVLQSFPHFPLPQPEPSRADWLKKPVS